MRIISVILASFTVSSCSAFSRLLSSKATIIHVQQRPNSNSVSSAQLSKTQLPAFRVGSYAEQEENQMEPEYLPVSSLQTKVFDPLSDAFIAALRVGTCALMIHHGIDKVDNVDGFSANVVAKFFGFLPGPPQFWTLSAAFTQIAGSGLLAVGVLARPVSLSMCATMVTAVIFHLLNTGAEGFPLAVVPQHSYNYELAAMYVAVLAYFAVAGAGAYSIDEKVFGGELNLYQSLVDKITNKEEEPELVSVVEEPIQKINAKILFPWSK